MQGANQAAATIEPSRANGQSHPHELFALTDEQILEIEPEAQDVEAQNSRLEAGATRNSDGPNARAANGEEQGRLSVQTQGVRTQTAPTKEAQVGVPVLLEPPAWLAETMNDPQRGAEARALWDGAQRAEQEAASYREVFAKPEEARAASERARVLDDIDRAYFAGDTSQRAQLAAMMMREDPAAFREMVFEGLRALEAAGQPGRARSVADAVAATLGSPSAYGNAAQSVTALRENSGQASPAPTAHINHGALQPSNSTQQHNQAEQHAQLAAYATFERAANEDLERSVGSAIEQTLTQALPNLTKDAGASGAGAQHSVAHAQDKAAPLQARLAAAIRLDVEKALQGDRQLGEQVAQILSGKRLDNETRAQVVQLIGERARQLVPGATKRALSDWTQTTLAAHRGKSAQGEAFSARREVASTSPGPRDLNASKQKATPRSTRTDERPAPRGRVDYRKFSDDQILDL
jgi:hypothetical protein